MTTIAYKDGVLAGDSLWTGEDGTVFTMAPKVFCLPSGVLYGGAGEGDDRALLKMLAKVKKPKDFPSVKQLRKVKQDLYGIVVFPNGQVFVIDVAHDKDGTVGVYEIPDRIAAIGSGGVHALAAMNLGKTAIEAVHFACERSVYSRPPVTHVELKPLKKPKR